MRVLGELLECVIVEKSSDLTEHGEVKNMDSYIGSGGRGDIF